MDFIMFLLVFGGIAAVAYWKRAEIKAWVAEKRDD